MPEPSPTNKNASEPSAQKAVDAVESASAAASAIASETGAVAQKVSLPDFTTGNGTAAGSAAAAVVASAAAAANVGINLLDDVTLRVKIELGRTQMYVEDVLRLNTNSVVELDKAAGDPVDIYVNDRHVARGEVLVLNENFCVRVSEIIQQVGLDE